MFRINCWSGEPTKKVKLAVKVELTFDVGGADDEDRMDSVRMAFDDHYDETINNSFWRDAITGMVVEDVQIVNEKREANT